MTTKTVEISSDQRVKKEQPSTLEHQDNLEYEDN